MWLVTVGAIYPLILILFGVLGPEDRSVAPAVARSRLSPRAGDAADLRRDASHHAPPATVACAEGRTVKATARRPGCPVTGRSHPHATLGRGPVATISREELHSRLDTGAPIKLAMALNRWAFDAKHIPGSLHFDTPDELYAAVAPEDEIVVYCSNVDCLASVAMYWDLMDRGYRNVRRFAGGLLDWEDAGLPLEGASTGL